MGNTHLRELQQALEQRGWTLVSEEGGDGYRTSGVWRIQRSTRAGIIELHFEGLDDLKVLPITKSYGCHAKGSENTSLYFGSMKEFRKVLPTFLSAMDALEDKNKIANKPTAKNAQASR
jgi:hypothetical protein